MKTGSYAKILDLPKRAEDIRVRIQGRVIIDSGGSCTIQDHTASVIWQCQTPPSSGSWVQLEGLWDGESIREAILLHLSEPTHQFTAEEGEWSWGRNGHIENLRARHAILKEVRNFFDYRDYVEVETPAMVSSPGVEPHLDAFEVRGASHSRFLNTSPEYQMKRLLVAGLPRIYQICKCYRTDEKGDLHEPEFTMLEWYRSFAGWNDLMRETEELVANLAKSFLNGSTLISGPKNRVDVHPPWQRITVADAFKRYANQDIHQLNEVDFYRALVEQVEPCLGTSKPVFLTHYPARMASLAKLDSTDPRFACRFEAYIDGIELCNGFDELIDPVEQKERFERDQQARVKNQSCTYPIDENFLKALREGMPPCAGNALGLDRLIMLLLGEQRIENVIAFPYSRL